MDDDLIARAAYAKAHDADILVCLHFNASDYGQARGATVFYSVDSAVSAVSRPLAQCILTQLVNRLGFANRGVIGRYDDGSTTQDYYGILRYCAWRGI